jgi:hypothetical protein
VCYDADRLVVFEECSGAAIGLREGRGAHRGFAPDSRHLIVRRGSAMKLKPRHVVAMFATLALACGGLSNSGNGDGGGSGGGYGTAGAGGGGGNAGSGGAGGTAGAGGSSGSGGGGTAGGGGGGTAGVGSGGTKGGGGGGTKGSGPADASPLDSALPDSSASPVETFELIYGTKVESPLSCPSEHWEFPLPSSSAAVYLRNTGSVPLAYTAESPFYTGAIYSPGVPTGTPGELVGILAPGASVNLTSTVVKSSDGWIIALVGASKPFSVYDGGYAASDETTIPWPKGVPDSAGATTMYVAQVESAPSCTPVAPVW